ncbi:MAG: glycosyltransferase [Candidatus Sumerlaeia bacterium]|nr:glycosyltransferase [Candidatus Sumerlaeia bacterium]
MKRRRVLIVSPHFPPTNAPDHQRVRMALPYYADFGWQADVLAVAAEDVEASRDEDLLRTLPERVEVTRAGALPARLTRRLGLGSIAWRALPGLYATGTRMLRRRRYDLVFFSTTQFATMALGPLWQAHLGVPYVLDFQDPWRTDYYARRGITPPGGAGKYAFARATGAVLEPIVVRRAAHIITVSRPYARALQRRYADLAPGDFTTLPFGASERDFDLAGRRRAQDAGTRRWVFIGAAGSVMRRALALLFHAIALERAAQPHAWNDVRLEFLGTSYAPPGREVPSVLPVAREFGLEALVRERPARVPYLESLRRMREADVLLLLGTDDAAYSGSKTATVLLAGRPVLALVHEHSPARPLLEAAAVGEVTTFASAGPDDATVARLREALRRALVWDRTTCPVLPPAIRRRVSARENARAQCRVFDRVVGVHRA